MKTLAVITCVLTSLLSFGQVVPSDYLLYFPLDGNATEMSSNKLNGQVIGSVIETTDKWNNPCGAMQFSNEGYISVPNGNVFKQISNAISILAWAKIDPSADNFWFTILCKGEVSESNYSPHFRFQFTKLTMALTNRVPTWEVEYDRGLWYHCALTFDGGDLNVYMNGMNIGSLDYSSERLNANNFPLEIGRDITGVTEFFSGSIDELYIYNRSLSPSEIRSIYNHKPVVNCNGNTDEDECDFPSTMDNVQIVWIKDPIVVNEKLFRLFASAATQESARRQVEISLNGKAWKSTYMPSKRVSIYDDQLTNRCNYLIIRSVIDQTVVFNADLEGNALFPGTEECSGSRYVGVKIIYEP
jgi:hypothetical protein